MYLCSFLFFSFLFFSFEVFWCTECKFILVLRFFYFMPAKSWISIDIYRNIWNRLKWSKIFSKWNKNTLDKIPGVATVADLYTRSRYHFFCEHLFNLLLGYIVKHHILVANRGFHFPLWNLGFYSTKKSLFFSIWVLQIWSDSLPKILVFYSYFISFIILFHIHFLPCGFC